ncbi:MAG: hypothetical protein PVF43_00190 [Candidatus Eiseniibacteriota bacterium]|jgi:hypothetical protein
MDRVFAAIALMLYAVASAGVVTVEYSCHETGTSGVTVAGPRGCYAHTCGAQDTRGAMRETAPVCGDSCCDIHVRASVPGDQIAGVKPAPDIAGDRDVVRDATPVTVGRQATASVERPPAGRFPGFDRPLLI